MPAPAIAIYGAIDRFNYGDLLFPIILDRAFREAGWDGAIQPVGFRRSDLSRFGALATAPARWLTEAGQLGAGSRIVIAGGEALAAGWWTLYSHLLPQRLGDPLAALATKLFPEQRLDRFAARRVGAPWPIPFCPRADDFSPPVPVLFNAVGGSGLAGRDRAWREEVAKAIRSARYASVRDEATLAALGGPSSGAELQPDSAANLPRLFPPDALRDRAGDPVRSILADGSPFLCFQLHRHFTDDKLRRFAKELDLLTRDLRVVLLPIGRAAGHSDQVALAKVRAAMARPAELLPGLGVFDLMALLAHTDCYAGTSLHGLITAAAYGRPCATLGKNPKCGAFAATWLPQALRQPLKASGFSGGVRERLTVPRPELDTAAAHLQSRAAAGLGRLLDAALKG